MAISSAFGKARDSNISLLPGLHTMVHDTVYTGCLPVNYSMSKEGKKKDKLKNNFQFTVE